MLQSNHRNASLVHSHIAVLQFAFFFYWRFVISWLSILYVLYGIEWWQQAFRNSVKDVIQDSKTIGCKPK